MPAYVIVDINVEDPVGYEDYKRLTPPSLRAYCGRIVVRGGATEVLEGKWEPGRILVLEFPTVEYAKQWWCSEEYATAKLIRQLTAETNMIVVNGLV